MARLERIVSKLMILGHLGLGDHLIANAIVRFYAQVHDKITVPAYAHNMPSLKFLYSDMRNVEIKTVGSDNEARRMADAYSGDVLRMGCFAGQVNFHWDRQMYAQAKLPFEMRWSGFKIPRNKKKEHKLTGQPYAFVHDDAARNFRIDRNTIAANVIVSPVKTDTVFEWCSIIEKASEVHVIDSSFAILADSLKLSASVLKIHLYARPNAKPPTYKKDWIILK